MVEFVELIIAEPVLYEVLMCNVRILLSLMLLDKETYQIIKSRGYLVKYVMHAICNKYPKFHSLCFNLNYVPIEFFDDELFIKRILNTKDLNIINWIDGERLTNDFLMYYFSYCRGCGHRALLNIKSQECADIAMTISDYISVRLIPKQFRNEHFYRKYMICFENYVRYDCRPFYEIDREYDEMIDIIFNELSEEFKRTRRYNSFIDCLVYYKDRVIRRCKHKKAVRKFYLSINA
jgi:hypothetical protein